MSMVKAQSMFHRTRTLIVDGLPDEITEIVDTSDMNFNEQPQPQRVDAASERTVDSWFKRQVDGKLFRSIRFWAGRVELQSTCGDFDVAIPSSMDVWKSISPTSHNIYCLCNKKPTSI